MRLLCEIENSFALIERYFNKKTIKEFFACDYKNLHLYHFGFGTWIRNTILSRNSSLRELFRQAGIMDEDDMSSLIITLFYIAIRTKPEAPLR